MCAYVCMCVPPIQLCRSEEPGFRVPSFFFFFLRKAERGPLRRETRERLIELVNDRRGKKKSMTNYYELVDVKTLERRVSPGEALFYSTTVRKYPPD